MTRRRKTKDVAREIVDALADDFAFDGDDLDGFEFNRDVDFGDPADEWADLAGEPSDAIAHDMLLRALAEDPFTTTDPDDCLPGWGTTPVAFSRYLRASAAFIATCRATEPDYEEQEIHRLIALYWLKRSRPIWLD